MLALHLKQNKSQTTFLRKGRSFCVGEARSIFGSEQIEPGKSEAHRVAEIRRPVGTILIIPPHDDLARTATIPASCVGVALILLARLCPPVPALVIGIALIVIARRDAPCGPLLVAIGPPSIVKPLQIRRARLGIGIVRR